MGTIPHSVVKSSSSQAAAVRSQSATIAAHTSWANTADRAARTAPARRAWLARFEAQVDPDGHLTPEDRAQRARSLMRAHMARLALRSAQARRRRAA